MPTWRPPGLRAVATYKRAWLRQDIVAGLVLSTLLVPQGMAYAELAGLPPITGLYTSVLCLIGYALFGPSRILVLGPDSSLGPMIAATLLPILASNGDPERAVALASLLALLVGVITTVAGVARLGFIADLISKPTQIGYMNGLALTILIGQLPKLCGFSVDADGVIDEARGFVDGLASGEVVGAALAVGLTAFALIIVLNRWLPRIPGVLMAVVVTIAAAALLDLGEHGVSLVGTLPQGFPPLTLPGPADDLPLLLAGAVGIALVSLTDTISTSSAFAARTGQEVDGNGEMIGIGAANIAASFFQGFPVSTSGSRTAVAERSGAKTQLTGLVGAGGDRADAGARAGPAGQPAAADAGRGRDRRVAVAGRHPRDRAAVASAPGRVPADRAGLPGRRAARRAGGDRGRGGAVDPERVPARVVAVPDHPRPRSRRRRPTRPQPVPRRRSAAGSS